MTDPIFHLELYHRIRLRRRWLQWLSLNLTKLSFQLQIDHQVDHHKPRKPELLQSHVLLNLVFKLRLTLQPRYLRGVKLLIIRSNQRAQHLRLTYFQDSSLPRLILEKVKRDLCFYSVHVQTTSNPLSCSSIVVVNTVVSEHLLLLNLAVRIIISWRHSWERETLSLLTQTIFIFI